MNSSSSQAYEMRGSGDGRSKKQSMAELKLRRLQELNTRLKEDLDRRRIPVSEAANDLIAFTDKEPKDYMVPSRWGTVRKWWHKLLMKMRDKIHISSSTTAHGTNEADQAFPASSARIRTHRNSLRAAVPSCDRVTVPVPPNTPTPPASRDSGTATQPPTSQSTLVTNAANIIAHGPDRRPMTQAEMDYILHVRSLNPSTG